MISFASQSAEVKNTIRSFAGYHIVTLFFLYLCDVVFLIHDLEQNDFFRIAFDSML